MSKSYTLEDIKDSQVVGVKFTKKRSQVFEDEVNEDGEGDGEFCVHSSFFCLFQTLFQLMKSIQISECAKVKVKG